VANGDIQGFAFCIIVSLVAIFWIQYEGVAIDCNQQRYQEYKTYLGVRFGLWEKLPPITNVLVYAYHEKIVRANRTWTTIVQQQRFYKVSIFDTRSDFALTVCKTSQEAEAFGLAERLAHHFQIEVETDLSV
jgi:hypothetical protein